jgi:hypothetical protein
MKGVLRTAVLLAASAALTSACGTETEPPGPAAKLEAASSRTGSGVVNTTLRDSLAVRVLDANGRPVPAVEVHWGTYASGGQVSPRVALTDVKGIARAALTLGTRAGAQYAFAEVLTVEGPREVEFAYEVLAGPTVTLRVAPDGSLLVPKETRQLSAVRTDAYGNLITGRALTWSTSNAAVATVDQNGVVTAVAPGSADIQASSEGQTSSARVAVASAIAEDLFNTNTPGLYTQYSDIAASWSVAGGVMTASGPGKQSHLIRNDLLFRDGWVEAEMDRADEGGLVLRFRDAGNLYLLAIRDDGSLLGTRNLELFKRVNGQFQLIQYGRDISWPRGTVKTVRFEVVGSRLRGYVDGVVVIEDTDSSISTAGAAGMRYHDVPEDVRTDEARYLTLRAAGQ